MYIADFEKYIKGAVQVNKTKDGVSVIRFTKEQFDCYDKSMFTSRYFFTNGVYFNFMTNSTTIELDYELSVCDLTTNDVCFDVLVDGILVASHNHGETTNNKGNFSVDLSDVNPQKQLKEVHIYFPLRAAVCIKNLVLAENSTIEECKKRDKLLCLGDSITMGVFTPHQSMNYVSLLSRELDMDVINQGVGGFYFEGDSIANIKTLNPNMVTVAYGTNDRNRVANFAEFQENLRYFLEKLNEAFAGVRCVVITPIWRGTYYEVKDNGVKIDDIKAEIYAQCEKYPNIEVVDGKILVPNHSDFLRDEVHPNEAGFAHFASNLAKRLCN